MEEYYISRLKGLLTETLEKNGKPFAALVVANDKIVAEAINETHLIQNPTAHAELLAIQRASKFLTKEQLSRATLYASGMPCTMCITAAQYAGIVNIVYYYNIEELQTVYPYKAHLRPVKLCKKDPEQLLHHIEQLHLDSPF